MDDEEFREIEEAMTRSGAELARLTTALADANRRTVEQKEAVEEIRRTEQRLDRLKSVVEEETEFYQMACDEYEPKTDFVLYSSRMGVDRLKSLSRRADRLVTKFENEMLPVIKSRILMALRAAREEVDDIKRRVDHVREEEAAMSRRKEAIQRRIEETRAEVEEMRRLSTFSDQRVAMLRREAEDARRSAREAALRALIARQSLGETRARTLERNLGIDGFFRNLLISTILGRNNDVGIESDNLNALNTGILRSGIPETYDASNARSNLTNDVHVDPKEIEFVLVLGVILTSLQSWPKKKGNVDLEKKETCEDEMNESREQGRPFYHRRNEGPLNERIWNAYFTLRNEANHLEEEINLKCR